MAKKKKTDTPRSFLFPLLVVFIFLLIIVFALMRKNTTHFLSPNVIPQIQKMRFDFGNNSSSIDEQVITFANGSWKSLDGKQSANIIDRTVNTQGNHAAAIFIYTSGGSGIFYYVWGASFKKNEKVYPEAYSLPVLLGDRIKILSLTVDNPQAEDNGIITVTYLDHGTNEPITAKPTVEVIKKFAFEQDGELLPILH